MRLILKPFWLAARGLMVLFMVWMCFVPASDSERAALGADTNRFALVQMRLARSMMTVAPDFVVAQYAQATDLPPEVIRQHLMAKASGQDITTAATRPETSNRQTRAGGALFVRPE